MSRLKDYDLKNVSIEDMVKKLMEFRAEILEDFSKAYLAETGLLPSEVELCNQQVTENQQIITKYFFRRKQNE